MFAVPSLATIAQVQSNATWGSTNTTNCTVTLGTTHTRNLLVVWAAWSPSTLTASVVDTSNNIHPFPSAVGATVQSASNTAAQIVYQNNIQPTVGTDTVKVSFNGTATTASCVAVEYSGADLNYPLDSVSAGYSTGSNPTSLLDSGTVAPANSNLLVFAGGISDNGAANAGTGFTSIQSHSFSGGGSAITEQNSSAITGNNTLQRATACLVPLPCPTTPTGNWVMQMAVFQDASWTVANAWTPVRPGQVRYATQFPGSDIGAQINAAYADGPSTGVHIIVPAGSYRFPTAINFATASKPAYLECDRGAQGNIASPTATTQLIFTAASGAAVTFNAGGGTGSGMSGCTLQDNQAGNTATGLLVGGSNGAVQHEFDNDDISGFQYGIQFSNNAYIDAFRAMQVHDNTTSNLSVPSGLTNVGENVSFVGGTFANKGSAFNQTCVDFETGGDFQFISVSFDQCGINLNAEGQWDLVSPHIENPNSSISVPYILFGTSTNQTRLTITGGYFIATKGNTGSSFILDTSTVSNHALLVDTRGTTFAPSTGTAAIINNTGNSCCGVLWMSGVQNGIGGETFTNFVNGGWLASTIWKSSGLYFGSPERLLTSQTNPTITSGFGSSPAISFANGAAAFQIRIGTGSPSSGVLSMPTASDGWYCTCTDLTTTSTSNFVCKQTAGSASSVTLSVFNDVATAGSWTSGDLLLVSCSAY